jgi:hypothetical protein
VRVLVGTEQTANLSNADEPVHGPASHRSRAELLPGHHPCLMLSSSGLVSLVIATLSLRIRQIALIVRVGEEEGLAHSTVIYTVR